MSAIVFYLFDRNTFENVNMWNESIQTIQSEDFMIILIDNKSGLNYKIEVTNLYQDKVTRR